MFSVNFWGSEPGTNDDCWCGEDFDSFDDAVIEFNKECDDKDVAWIELDGPGIYFSRKNPSFKESKKDSSEWKREIAMQAGIVFGCDGYNDEMGW